MCVGMCLYCLMRRSGGGVGVSHNVCEREVGPNHKNSGVICNSHFLYTHRALIIILLLVVAGALV